DIQTCRIDFDEPNSDTNRPFMIASYAKTLVHEATHGLLEARGVNYTAELRSRIEHLCVTEENRFLDRLVLSQPGIAARLYRNFDESEWALSWNATRRERISSLFNRMRS